LSLRADDHSQYEIRAYADVMIDSLKRWVPITYEAFMDYRIGGMELSSKGKSVISKMIKGEKCDFENSKLSKREWNELMESFGFKEKMI
jgi:thymidylate synthase (FAD)